ncbi:MAG: Flp pilus assembly protein CpaB [Deltaproteobacteria bacterium]|nr:Flp pilus assembly protein CpaB [Deltaproteobacteria bacterium]
MKNVRALLLSFIVALVATFAQCRYVHSREQVLLYDSEPLRTLVATVDIPAKVRLDETMVQLVDVPRKWQQPKALSSMDAVIGQISSVPIFQGEQVVATKLVTVEDAGLAFYVPKGYRALAIAVDVYNAVGGHIRPGNHVDILGSFDFGSGEKSDLRTVTLQQDVWVLSVVDDIGAITAREVVPPPDPENPERYEPPPGPSELLQSQATITIAVTPADAQRLSMAQEIGRLGVVLRSLWESETKVELTPATVQTVLGMPEQVRSRTRPAYRLIEGGL